MTARPWPIPSCNAFDQLPDGCILINHVSDTHFGYRPWSFDEGDHMLRDIQQGLIPPVDVMVHTGDMIDDVSSYCGVSPLATQDSYTLNWLPAAAKGAPNLWVPGNHDYWDRPNRLRSEWESVYGRPANSFVDVAGWRIVGFAPSVHTSPDNLWTIEQATWDWLDQVCASAPGPIILADHYPPQELEGSNYVDPPGNLDALIAGYPSIAGMLTGHEHYNIEAGNSVRFLPLGGRQLPVISDVSSLFSQSIASRDQSARVPTISCYITAMPDRWEIRYRSHGAHRWTGPLSQRVTTMDLATATVAHHM